MKKYKNIEEFENYLNESLKSTGFETPDSYFENFEEQISSRLYTESLPNETGYKTPDLYFSNLEDKLIKKVTSESKVISLKSRVLTWIPTAAAACILLFLALNYNSNTLEPNSDEIYSWFENDLSLVSENDLVLALEEGDIEDSNFTSIFNENAIENYLQNVDTSDLINEFEEE